jgi:hypothetical protein
MANDGRPNDQDEEREFLAGLKARTGRDLAEWMAAIAAQGFHDKNEIIDWLRTQGLPFARASWLERIHRNGGKPIHSATGPDPAGPKPGHARPPAPPPRLVVVASAPRPAPLPVQAPPQPAPPPPPAAARIVTQHLPPVLAGPKEPGVRPAGSDPKPGPDAGPKPAPKSVKKAPKPPPRVEAPGDAAALEKLVSAAKGYRPLYQHLEAQIRRAIAGAAVAARDRYVAIGAPLEFAAVTLHPTEVRLGLALGDRPFDAALQPAKLRGSGPTITHMLLLTDARQVNDELLALLKAANARVNA